MKDQELVKALREHAEWQRGNEWETPITLGDDLVEAADRIANQDIHILALQAEDFHRIPAADVAPIEALERLRDELYTQDLITMEGLRKLNTLIGKYTTVYDGRGC